MHSNYLVYMEGSDIMGDYNNGGHCPDCDGDSGRHYPGCIYEGTGDEHYYRGSGNGFSFFNLSISIPIGFILTILLLSDLGLGGCGAFFFLVVDVLVTIIVEYVIERL